MWSATGACSASCGESGYQEYSRQCKSKAGDIDLDDESCGASSGTLERCNSNPCRKYLLISYKRLDQTNSAK